LGGGGRTKGEGRGAVIRTASSGAPSREKEGTFLPSLPKGKREELEKGESRPSAYGGKVVFLGKERGGERKGW